MRSLFRFIIKNYGFLLFLFLEVISFVFIFNYNNYQKVKFLNSSNIIFGSVYNTYESVVSYFELSKVNEELAAENARLKNLIERIYDAEVFPDSISKPIPDSSANFRYTTAKIIQNSVNKQLNYITLNKGSIDGVKPDQAIISAQGIVGVVTKVSKHYAMGLSVLNKRWSISAKLKKSGFYGSLVWDGTNFRHASLTEIPFHIEMQHGDTVVTSGYSSIFPEGVLIGTIQSFEEPPGENYYNIRVKLSTDFKSISRVEIVENMAKDELESLEQNTKND